MAKDLPDPVIALYPVAADLLSLGAKAKELAGAAAQGGSVVELKIVVVAPQGECRVRLWDAEGRNPVGSETDNWAWSFSGSSNKERRCRLEDAGGRAFSPGDLRHRTVTWSVRLEPSAPDAGERYEVEVEVLQDGNRVDKGKFIYSGPLDDFEELTGRFHFTLRETSPAA